MEELGDRSAALASTALDRVRIVLCRPSHPGNIGAAARAMKTMGLSRLVLVAPERPPDAQAVAMASGATDEGLKQLRSGLALYGGDYLPDALYEDWSSEEREQLLALYLRTADRLASELIEQGAHEEGLELCEAILSKDSCWERAYRLMMAAYAAQGNCSQALKTYHRCVEVLRGELNVGPSAETRALYRKLCGAL